MTLNWLLQQMSSKHLRIALAGQLRSGKDTVADLIQEQQEFTVLRFADGITEIIEKYFPEANRIGKPRQHYQVIGQSLRQLDQGVWIKHLHKQVQQLSQHENLLITDVRQVNESIYCKSNGFTLIKVIADEEVRAQRAIAASDVFDPAAFLHETEITVNSLSADYVIENNGSLDELAESVSKILKEITG